MTGVRVRSVAAGRHRLALSWDGRVYSWGDNQYGQLGQGDKLDTRAPVLVQGLEGVRSIAASAVHSFAVTQSGAVSSWGRAAKPGAQDSLRPVIIEGFGGVRMRCVCPGGEQTFAIGEDGELFSWGRGKNWLLGHGDTQDQPSPKRVEALQGVPVSSVAVGESHALALAEDGLVYAWGGDTERTVLGNPYVERELLPTPVEALGGVRIGSVAAAGLRSYAVADTGVLWAWGVDGEYWIPLGHGEFMNCPLPKPMNSLWGVKVDAVIAGGYHTVALANNGRVYTWGAGCAAMYGALGRELSDDDEGEPVPRPRRISLQL
jgi:alpha-tubulin suppressor-like RCC1 family protein